MTIFIVLLLLNVSLLIGVIIKWQVGLKKCGGRYNRMLPSNRALKKYPFIVKTVILDNEVGELYCGGVVVSPHWVVTTGYCVDMINTHSKRNIITYIQNVFEDLENEVILAVHHPDFNKRTLSNDLGLLKVAHRFEKIVPIQIAGGDYNYKVNSSVSAVGFNNEMRKFTATIFLFSQNYCSTLYNVVKENLTRSMVCAGLYTEKKPECRFDLGSPLIDGKVLIGIISWGKDCEKVEIPTIYTKVAHFEEWIKATIVKDGEDI
ncbi:hypothetical protein RI129_009996 [Pyrocoelia pectoralis]|uniref:Peptidase S1 domain-containing protein n=1 Tax=Pyrocoelia pectoralis TaxID=417401 RepID=A0AAN7VDM7_9COLE